MNSSLSPVLTPRQQLQLHELLADQVKSYHHFYHMGENSSVPTETAQELLRSVWYTLDLGSGDSLAERLGAGQEVLASRVEKARQLHRLAEATCPDYQDRYRWETIAALGRYLQRYDHLHFAHRIPEDLDYPLLTPPPEGLTGIDYCCYYLNCLWLENQILYHFSGKAVAELFLHLPPDYWEAPQNLCEPVLTNALGRLLLDKSMDSLLVDPEALLPLLERDAGEKLYAAMERLARLPGFSRGESEYARAVVPAVLPRLLAALPGGNLHYIFIS